jgi:uncharacterized protein YbdZ (MbtH family)
MHEEPDDDPFEKYAVVVNHEEQYSIWPTEKPMPSGWRTVGRDGSKKECLDYIGDVWTDMRPLSLRRQMEEWARTPPAPAVVDASLPQLPPLVDRLSAGEHALIFNCRPARTAKALKERLDMGYVHVKFTGTRGGTELGVRVDPQATDCSAADFERQTGTVRLVGMLTLDYVKVRCVAAIDVSTLEGTGHLEKIGNASLQAAN